MFKIVKIFLARAFGARDTQSVYFCGTTEQKSHSWDRANDAVLVMSRFWLKLLIQVNV